MAQVLEVIDMITSEALLTAHESASFIKTTNLSFDSQFGKTGAKIGDALRIRLPSRGTIRTGRAMNVEDVDDDSVTLTVATQKGADLRFTSAEMALGMDYLSERYIKPRVQQLISEIEYDYITGVTKYVGNLSGTAGTAMSDLAALGDARAKLNGQAAPKRDRAIMMDSIQMSGVVNGLKGLYQGQIKEAMREGFYGRLAMGDLYENERVWTMTNAADVAGTLDTVTLANGDVTIACANMSAAPNAGMVFTLAGVYAVHPETKQSLGYLRQFTVGSGTASTTSSIKLDDPIYVSGPKQNVFVSAAYTTTGAIVFVGDASKLYRQGLMYHKDAFAFVTADLPLLGEMSSRKSEEGLSIRVTQDVDIRNDELLTRIDVLYGYKAIRPEWACRLIGAASA
jgi:hypothetical protein